MRIPAVALTLAFVWATRHPLTAQSRSSALIAAARAHLTAHQLDSGEVLLRAALDSATQRSESANVFAWRGILSFLRGDESGTSTAFYQALVLDSTTKVLGLALMSPRLEQLFQEQRVELTNDVVYPSADVDEKPRRIAGPSVRYPPDLLRRQVRGRAMVGLTVDTLGRAVPTSIEIFSTPDSELVEPVRRMLLASRFSRGRIRGRAVRTLIQLAIDLIPGSPPTATTLVNAARVKLAQLQPDSALGLVRDALDPATRPTDGEKVYARLVQGIALTALGRDSLARAAFDTALAGYQSLTARGVELAPFLKRLADSVRLGRAGRTAGILGNPAVVTAVDVPPALLSRPAIRYPPEMQSLRVGGTVTVEATIDTTGHVVPTSVTVVQSPNRGLDAEARRVVAAAFYRPGRRAGHLVSTVIRQAVTFVPY